jgi:integrase
MPHLTKRVIDALAPREKAYIYGDDTPKNFGVRVYPSGHKAYVITYRPVPATRITPKKIYTLGACNVLALDQARDLARQWLVAIRQGVDPVAQKDALRQAPTVAELAERYLAEHAEVKKKPRSLHMDRVNLRLHVLPALGQRLVHDIARADIATLHHAMRATPGAANRVLALLSKMFGLAEQWGLRPQQSNPIRGIERYRERQLERFLTAEELARLGAVLHEAERTQTERPSVIAAIRLLILTGARLGEILGLRWEHIDWQRGLAHLSDSKTGEKSLYLSPAAIEVLRSLVRQQGNPYVLPGRHHGKPLINPRKPWTRLCRQAELEGVRLHDLRHTYASMGVALGLSLPILGKLLGHQQAATTQRYAHLAPNPVHEAAHRVGARLREALGG